MEPKGTIIFSTVGRPYYGFDIFSLQIPSNLSDLPSSDQCLTDGISINFNAQFLPDKNNQIVFISDRSGSSQIYMTQSQNPTLIQLPSVPDSLFHDRPIIKNGTLYFISAHEQPNKQFQSWSALYSTDMDSTNKITRLTPYSSVDYSPAVSKSGKYIAVASYGSRIWGGEFHELQSDIVIFPVNNPGKRIVVSNHGGWPTWSDDSTIYFHRQADDGWWSVFRFDLPDDFDEIVKIEPRRVTPSGVHSFTPAAFHDGKRIAVATRRRGNKFRHIEIFDETTSEFYPVTQLLNPDFHHYNPFVSSEGDFLGYHRFRGGDSPGEKIIPNLYPVTSPIKDVRILRLNGFFPSFSPDGKLIAFNSNFDTHSGTKIVRSDGSKKWNLFSGRVAFYNSWSPTENNVIYTSIGPIFGSVKANVQIARISFNLEDFTDDIEDIPVNIKILTKEGTENNAFPACSPDGKSIVFRSSRSGYKNLYLFDSVTGEIDNDGIRQLTHGPCIDTMPSWSPDGKLIAFSSNRHNPGDERAFSIYLIHPDGTGLRRVYLAGSEDADRERVNHVCFSADGEWLLFTANLGGVTAEPVSIPNQFQPYGDLYLARVDGSELQRLTSDPYENGTPAWHVGAEVDLGSLDLSGHVGDELRNGLFEEPLWISCDL